MKLLIAVAAATLVSASLSAVPNHAFVERAVSMPVAQAHVVMTPPPDYFGSLLVTR